jgi:hypothetical protein
MIAVLGWNMSYAQSPSFVWAKGFGSSTSGWGYDIKTDPAGNVYTIGFFSGTADFDPGASTSTLVSAGGYDIYISKLDVNGNYVWAKRFGGTTNDTGHGIALDNLGNIYATGIFTGTADFDPGSSTSNLSSAGGNDVFVVKLDNNGNFIWAGRIGGSSISGDFGNTIAVDASNNIYLGGYFYGSADFDPGSGISNLTSSGNAEIFISKLDTNGNLLWAKQMGGTTIDLASHLVVDNLGNVFTTGYFQGAADFDPGTASFLMTAVGGEDIFISKLDTNGNFVFAKSIGGASDDYGTKPLSTGSR